MSKKSLSFFIIFLLLSVIFTTPIQAQSSLITHFGILGDSATDEYRANDNRGGSFGNVTFNWIEELVRLRGFNVGPWGSRSEPRRTGYEYNFARSGATASSMISSGQHTGLASYIQSGKVELAFIMIGSNDFGYWNTSDGYAPIYNGTLSGTALQNKINSIINNITLAVDTLKAAGNVKILLVTLADPSLAPAVLSQYPDATKRARVTNAVNSVNTGITSMAVSRGVAVIDSNRLGQQLISRFDQSTGTFPFWGETIQLTPADEPHHFQLSDGIHSGTITSSILANYIVDSMNSSFAANVAPLTEAEVLTLAGITPKYPDGCALDTFDHNKRLNMFDMGYIITQPNPVNPLLTLIRNWNRWCP